MRPSTIRAVIFSLTGVAWPVLMITVSLLWPGPTQPAVFGSPAVNLGVPSTLPPVDESGSTMRLIIEFDPATSSTTVSIGGEDGAPATRIFWDIPLPDSVPDSATSAEPGAG